MQEIIIINHNPAPGSGEAVVIVYVHAIQKSQQCQANNIIEKMGSAKDQRKCWLILWLFVYKVCLLTSMQVVAMSDNESRIVERVSRKLDKDINFFSDGSNMNCGDKNTYLISEDQCVKDQELFEGNKFEPYILYHVIIITIIQDAVMPLFQLVPCI